MFDEARLHTDALKENLIVLPGTFRYNETPVRGPVRMPGDDER